MTGLDKFVRGEYEEPEPQPLTRESVERAIEKMNEQNKKRNYDYTSTQRAARRAAHLHQVAQANGYDTWYKLETAVINGATLTVGQPGGMVDADGNVGESYQQSTERAIMAAIAEMAHK